VNSAWSKIKSRVKKFYRQIYFDGLVVLLMLGFSCWLMMSTFGYRDGQIMIDSKLYSDFGAHLPLTRSFSFGHNFPPEYPFFAGEPIRYHYFFYLIVGLLERIGLRIDWALNVPSIIGFWLLLIMIYRVTLLFFKNRLASVLAILLFLFNGSLSFVEYFDQQGWTIQALLEIPKQLHFASFGPWSGRLVSAFNSLNIYTNQRHLALSFALVLVGLYPLLKNTANLQKTTKKSSKLKVLLETLISRKGHAAEAKTHFFWLYPLLIPLFIMLPLLHQAGYLILIYLSFCFLMFYLKAIPRALKLVYLVAITFSLYVFLSFTTGSNQPIAWVFGYLANDKSVFGLLNYWWYNMGVYLLLLPILLWVGLRQKNFLLFLAFGLFVLANIARLSPDMINNHKLINFFMIIVAIFTAGLLAGWLKRAILTCLLTILLLPSLIFSGVLDLFPIINDYNGGIDDWRQSPIQTWIKSNTPPRAQFLTASYLYHPASLVGRPIFLDYGYHAWSMGYDDHNKRQLLDFLWSSSVEPNEWCQTVLSQNLNYVIVGPLEKLINDKIAVDESVIVKKFHPIYSSPDGWRVWDISMICQDG